MRLRSLLLAVVLGCSTAAAQRTGSAAAIASAPSGGLPVLDPAALGPYPAPDSAEGKADLAIVLWLQRTRTAEDVARSTDHAKITLDSFAPALPAGFQAASFPATRALLDRAAAYGRPSVAAAKDRYRRPRPYEADGRVQPAIGLEPSFSYPSGHATRGLLLARVLGELLPDRRDAILRVGLQLGDDRVVGGVHYPSDVLAGQQIADALARRLLADPDFRRALEAARAQEWASAGPPVQ